MPAGDALGIRRKRPGIQSFFNRLADSTGLNILDLGMLSQRTPALVCSLGHSIYNASLLHSFDAARAANPASETGMERQAASEFVRNHLDFRPDTFHGVLAWDVLQHLDKAAMLSTIAHLAKILRPDGTMLCLFHRKAPRQPFQFSIATWIRPPRSGSRRPTTASRVGSSVSENWNHCSRSSKAYTFI